MNTGVMTLRGYPSISKIEFEAQERIACVLRPESFMINPPNEPYNNFEGVIEWAAFVGYHTEVRIDVAGHKLMVDVPSDVETPVGENLKVFAPERDTIFLPLE